MSEGERDFRDELNIKNVESITCKLIEFCEGKSAKNRNLDMMRIGKKCIIEYSYTV